LESNIKRFKEKLFDSRQGGKVEKTTTLNVGSLLGEEKVEEPLIERRKRFVVLPMSEEEAVLQMESLGHTSSCSWILIQATLKSCIRERNVVTVL